MTGNEDYFGGLSREEYEKETLKHFEELKQCCPTDNEIIKALECHVRAIDDIKNTCIGCPLYDCTSDCSHMLARCTFDLINRQKTEKEKLEIELQAMRGAANSYKAEVERLKKDIQEGIEFEIEYNIAEIKSKAIKEFADRLKDTFRPPYDYSCKYIKYELDNLVDELTHQPTKIEHNSLCETETYESR